MNYGNNTLDIQSLTSFYCISSSHNAFAAVLDMIQTPFYEAHSLGCSDFYVT